MEVTRCKIVAAHFIYYLRALGDALVSWQPRVWIDTLEIAYLAL